jgi:phosphomethylpyrimidine synthase
VRVYDTSGPWGDSSATLDPVRGLPPLRRPWILKRGDVEEIEGRVVSPRDDGFLSEIHAKAIAKRDGNSKLPRRRPLRASAGHAVTQLWYARQGIITPEMEFIAIRENLGREQLQIVDCKSQIDRNDPRFAHQGSEPICNFKSEHCRVCPLRSCTRSRYYSREHQSP